MYTCLSSTEASLSLSLSIVFGPAINHYDYDEFLHSPSWLGLPLTSIFLLEYSLIPEVLLIQATNDEEGVVGQCTWGLMVRVLNKRDF